MELSAVYHKRIALFAGSLTKPDHERSKFLSFHVRYITHRYDVRRLLYSVSYALNLKKSNCCL